MSTIDMDDMLRGSGPRYRRIAEALKARIVDGRLPPGTRLPAQRNLADRLGVTLGTVTRAYNELVREGLAHGEVGRGTHVRPAAGQSPDSRGPPGTIPQYSDAAAETIDLAIAALPAPIPANALARATSRAAARPDLWLGYEAIAGDAAPRAALARWLSDSSGTVASADEILLTCGTQHGLWIALTTLLRPGDTLLTDPLTYQGMVAAAHRLGIRVVAVPRDESGMTPEALRAASERTGARAVYLIPTHHNPTAKTMPTARRQALAETAQAADLAIIEDDVFAFVSAAEAPPRLATLAPERCLLAGSFAKALTSGLRLGYLRVPPPYHQASLAALKLSTWKAPPVLAAAVAELIDTGEAAEAVAQRRDELTARMALAAEMLAPWDPTAPQGGLFLWLPVPAPWTGDGLTTRLAERGVAAWPGHVFALRAGEGDAYIRLSVASPPDRAQLGRGLAVVRAVLAEQPPEAPLTV